MLPEYGGGGRGRKREREREDLNWVVDFPLFNTKNYNATVNDKQNIRAIFSFIFYNFYG